MAKKLWSFSVYNKELANDDSDYDGPDFALRHAWETLAGVKREVAVEMHKLLKARCEEELDPVKDRTEVAQLKKLLAGGYKPKWTKTSGGAHEALLEETGELFTIYSIELHR